MTDIAEPGKWYFVVSCTRCLEPIAFAMAPSPEEKPDQLRHRPVANLKCLHCGQADSYPPSSMTRQQ